jgi:lipoprotein NlpI
VNRGVAFQGMNDHHRAISDFDRAIAVGSRLDWLRALAYYGRGVSWKLVGDFDRADADYRQALAFSPRFSRGHEELGVIADVRHDFDAAIAHLDHAIKLSPRHASHYKMRGRVYFDRGDFVAAETDLRYAINLSPDDTYALLFWFLASCKMGRNAAQELGSRARGLKGQQWPFAIIKLYLGKIGDDAVRAAAANSDDRAEAEFYVGEWHLLAGRRTEALAALQVAAESCPVMFMEHTAAVMELMRQGISPGAAG